MNAQQQPNQKVQNDQYTAKNNSKEPSADPTNKPNSTEKSTSKDPYSERGGMREEGESRTTRHSTETN